MEKINVNGREYLARELDFNFVCNLQEAGIGVEELDSKILPATRVYIAYCMGTSLEVAGNEINAHIINGGDMTSLISVFGEKAEESDFFRALNRETEQKKDTKRTSKKSEAEA